MISSQFIEKQMVKSQYKINKIIFMKWANNYKDLHQLVHYDFLSFDLEYWG